VPWSEKVATQPYSSSPPDQKISRLETSKAEARDLNRAVEARAAKCCTWKDCPTTLPFANDANLERHLQSHAGDVIQRRSGDGGCTWSGCHSKAKFKLSALKLHLQNVHVKPLICVQPGCSFKRPFRSISDLHRHVHTKHSQTGVFRCPYKECRSSTRTFKRKDKWLEHVEDAQHQLDNFCPVQHCWLGARDGCINFHPPQVRCTSHVQRARRDIGWSAWLQLRHRWVQNWRSSFLDESSAFEPSRIPSRLCWRPGAASRRFCGVYWGPWAATRTPHGPISEHKLDPRLQPLLS